MSAQDVLAGNIGEALQVGEQYCGVLRRWNKRDRIGEITVPLAGVLGVQTQASAFVFVPGDRLISDPDEMVEKEPVTFFVLQQTKGKAHPYVAAGVCRAPATRTPAGATFSRYATPDIHVMVPGREYCGKIVRWNGTPDGGNGEIVAVTGLRQEVMNLTVAGRNLVDKDAAVAGTPVRFLVEPAQQVRAAANKKPQSQAATSVRRLMDKPTVAFPRREPLTPPGSATKAPPTPTPPPAVNRAASTGSPSTAAAVPPATTTPAPKVNATTSVRGTGASTTGSAPTATGPASTAGTKSGSATSGTPTIAPSLSPWAVVGRGGSSPSSRPDLSPSPTSAALPRLSSAGEHTTNNGGTKPPISAAKVVNPTSSKPIVPPSPSGGGHSPASSVSRSPSFGPTDHGQGSDSPQSTASTPPSSVTSRASLSGNPFADGRGMLSVGALATNCTAAASRTSSSGGTTPLSSSVGPAGENALQVWEQYCGVLKRWNPKDRIGEIVVPLPVGVATAPSSLLDADGAGSLAGVAVFLPSDHLVGMDHDMVERDVVSFFALKQTRGKTHPYVAVGVCRVESKDSAEPVGDLHVMVPGREYCGKVVRWSGTADTGSGDICVVASLMQEVVVVPVSRRSLVDKDVAVVGTAVRFIAAAAPPTATAPTPGKKSTKKPGPLALSITATSVRRLERPRMPCRYYRLSGHCSKGDGCPFAHVSTPTSSSGSNGGSVTPSLMTGSGGGGGSGSGTPTNATTPVRSRFNSSGSAASSQGSQGLSPTPSPLLSAIVGSNGASSSATTTISTTKRGSGTSPLVNGLATPSPLLIPQKHQPIGSAIQRPTTPATTPLQQPQGNQIILDAPELTGTLSESEVRIMEGFAADHSPSVPAGCLGGPPLRVMMRSLNHFVDIPLEDLTPTLQLAYQMHCRVAGMGARVRPLECHQYAANGACRWGHDCMFIHVQLRGDGDNSNSGSTRARRPSFLSLPPSAAGTTVGWGGADDSGVSMAWGVPPRSSQSSPLLDGSNDASAWAASSSMSAAFAYPGGVFSSSPQTRSVGSVGSATSSPSFGFNSASRGTPNGVLGGGGGSAYRPLLEPVGGQGGNGGPPNMMSWAQRVAVSTPPLLPGSSPGCNGFPSVFGPSSMGLDSANRACMASHMVLQDDEEEEEDDNDHDTSTGSGGNNLSLWGQLSALPLLAGADDGPGAFGLSNEEELLFASLHPSTDDQDPVARHRSNSSRHFANLDPEEQGMMEDPFGDDDPPGFVTSVSQLLCERRNSSSPDQPIRASVPNASPLDLSGGRLINSDAASTSNSTNSQYNYSLGMPQSALSSDGGTDGSEDGDLADQQPALSLCTKQTEDAPQTTEEEEDVLVTAMADNISFLRVQIDPVFDDRKCTVCLDRPRDHLLVGCNHFYFCGRCAENIIATSRRCPACGMEVTSAIRVAE